MIMPEYDTSYSSYSSMMQIPLTVSGVNDIFELIIGLGDRLERLTLDRNAVGIAMRCLHKALSLSTNDNVDLDDVEPTDLLSFQEEVFSELSNVTEIRPWRSVWSEQREDDFSPFTLLVQELHFYAFFGVFEEREEAEADTLGKIKRFIEMAKRACETDTADSSTARNLNKTLLAAQGRLALDEGLGVTAEQLAALARIEIKSLRNMLAPGSGSGLTQTEKSGPITAASALNWLNARGKFPRSNWRDPYPQWDETRSMRAPTTGEIFWVPFANDKIDFHPITCRRDGKYTVGSKGYEQTFGDYRQALDCLARMQPAPCWKYPANNWGTVVGVGFRPRTLTDFGLQPSDLAVQSDQAGGE